MCVCHEVSTTCGTIKGLYGTSGYKTVYSKVDGSYGKGGIGDARKEKK